MKSLKIAAVAAALFISSSANAVIINTLKGIDYQWLELSNTTGMSRTQVDTELLDSTSDLYGYEYASTSLLSDLFKAYIPWDGVIGYHSSRDEVEGVAALLNDFGTLSTNDKGNVFDLNTHEGQIVQYQYLDFSDAIFGMSHECGGLDQSCFVDIRLLRDAAGDPSATFISRYSALVTYPYESLENYRSSSTTGSFLVKQVTAVPVPSALLLFGSGFIALLGFVRNKKA